MDFDWSLFSAREIKPEEVAESFEDPFCLRLMPDSGGIAAQSRFFCLGRSLSGRGLFSSYSTNGKLIRVLVSRSMTEEEEFFYNRKAKEYL